MTTAFAKSTRLLHLIWYGIMLGAFPMIAVALVLAVQVGQADFGAWDPDVPESIQWALAAGLMGIGVLVGGLARRKLLAPAQMARRSVPGEPGTAREGAEMRVRQAVIILLTLYETPAILLLGYSLATGELQWAVVAALYMVMLGVLAKPDFQQLLKETERALQR